MYTKNTIFATTNALDITQEKRELKLMITAKEKQLTDLQKRIEFLKQEIDEFQKLYDDKLRKLYEHLNELDRKISKYRYLSEFVDEHLTFSEAEEVYDETMDNSWANMAGEYVNTHPIADRVDRKLWMSMSERIELKRLYRKLAHLFHPDIKDGNEQIMMSVNKAYAEGDLETLREIELEHCPADKNNVSLDGLKRQLSNLIQKIDNAKTEVKTLRKSDYYVMKRNMLRVSGNNSNIFANLIKKVKREIRKKEAQLDAIKRRSNQSNDEI
jgi:hypothetical protein